VRGKNVRRKGGKEKTTTEEEKIEATFYHLAEIEKGGQTPMKGKGKLFDTPKPTPRKRDKGRRKDQFKAVGFAQKKEGSKERSAVSSTSAPFFTRIKVEGGYNRPNRWGRVG